MSYVTVTKTTPPVTVVCSYALTTAMILTVAPTSLGLEATFIAWFDSSATTNPEGHSEGYWWPYVSEQQHQCQMPSQAYANDAMGPEVSFSFRVGSPTHLPMLVFVVEFAFYFQIPIWLPFLPMGLNLEFGTIATLQSIIKGGISVSRYWMMAYIRGPLSSCSLHSFR